MVSEPSTISDSTIKGICGQVDGSVISGMIGLEAGQSGFGDVLAWYKEMMMWPIENFVLKSDVITDAQKQMLYKEIDEHIIEVLTTQAKSLPIEEYLPTALDWINGRRTPDADQSLKSALSGLSLGTKAPHIFKSLMYAICFGSKKIVERFESEGVVIDKITGIGGVARKSQYIMQLLADTLDKPIFVVSSDYAPALGAAVYAAVAAGLCDDVTIGSALLGSKVEASYMPNPENVLHMQTYYETYSSLANYIETNNKKLY
jgi:L-ribulokinase